ncbi:DUF362 domain-containing protein [Sphaerochaeta sp. PS]|uniref:DUF362 domain-containing protein n=1 Tax=Sphaerochaeta sp. PS TaxID=3076336 RepID=UPI0028A54340|nr:DUF362 domain-containing protein [Sphaerochaeta sp. PS]MDT4763382.1 DUF362 domain-containing protein [Sphaerochaeta sp. PS]
MSSVAIVACENYEQAKVDLAVEQACLAANMPSVLDKRVLLKPNVLSDAKEERCITTNTSVVRAVIHLLKKQGAKEILVGDSPGLQGLAFVPRSCGLDRVCKEEGVRWVDFTQNPTTRTIPYTRGKSLPLASILDEVDLLFSLPKLKTHQLMYTTGAVKNLFGLVPGLHKSPCHVLFPTRELFATLIVGILKLAKPSFSLMDGIIGMEGPGPANGKPRHMGLILASTDALALDYAQAVVMGYDPLTIPIIAEGLRREAGSKPSSYPLLDANDLIVEDFQRIQQQKQTSFFHSLIAPFFLSRYIRRKVKKDRKPPVFLVDPCIQCRRCIEICPVQALHLEGKRIIINEKVCVRCYCCHEVCPAHAIEIEEQREA